MRQGGVQYLAGLWHATSCCLTLLLISVGWYIMGYEPDPLPSHRELRNRSYTIKSKLNFTLDYYYSRPTSWSHHLISKLDPIIHYALVHSS